MSESCCHGNTASWNIGRHMKRGSPSFFPFYMKNTEGKKTSMGECSSGKNFWHKCKHYEIRASLSVHGNGQRTFLQILLILFMLKLGVIQYDFSSLLKHFLKCCNFEFDPCLFVFLHTYHQKTLHFHKNVWNASRMLLCFDIKELIINIKLLRNCKKYSICDM